MIYNAFMINLCSAKYGEYYGSHECECGKIHTFSVKCCLEKGSFAHISEFISSFTPELSRVAIFYDDVSEQLAVRCEDGLKRSYRTVKIKVENDKTKLNKLTLPEDSRLIIAVGGKAIESAKYKATLSDLPVVASGQLTHISLMPVCSLGSLPVTLMPSRAPVGYIFDPSFEFDKAEVFGSIAACLNTSFEYYASMALNNGEYCPHLSAAMSDIAAKTVLAASECDKNSPMLRELLLSSSLKIALLLSALPPFGEVQCALVSHSLFPKFSLGMLEFVYAAVLSTLYKSHIMRRRSFVPPPDNNYRLEQIAELYGISEFTAIKTIIRQMSISEAELVSYKISEYAPEFIEKLSKNINLYKHAFRTFKRLMSDGGFSLGDIVNSDISLCLALAPDIIKGEGMLTTLKRLGELDCYID